MPFDIVIALVAGFVGTVVMSLLMKMSANVGMTDMPPMPLVVGTMMSGDRPTAKRIGMLVHYIVMGTVVFGIVYGLLFSAFGTAGWLTGAVIGLVHGILFGAAGMPMMERMHPRMEPALVGSGGETVRVEDGEVRLTPPGFFGVNWGQKTPVGMVVGHVVYGLVVALVYGLLI